MLALGAEHDRAHVLVGVERGEGGGKLRPLRHGHDIQRRAGEHDVGARRRAVHFHPEAIAMAVEVVKGAAGRHPLPPPRAGTPALSSSSSKSPALSSRRRTLPTGDFGIARTKT